MLLNAFKMPRTKYCKNVSLLFSRLTAIIGYAVIFFLSTFPYAAREVFISLIDKHFFDCRKIRRQFAHHRVHLALVLKILNLIARHFLLVKCGGKKRRKELHLSPERIFCPCTAERNLNRAVYHLCRNCGLHFITGRYAHVCTHAALKSRKNKIRHE